MSFTDIVTRFLRPRESTESKSAAFAYQYFRGSEEQIARAVVFSVASTLCVDVDQLTPSTDIVAELAADEWTEWAEIQLCIEEQLQCSLSPDPRFEGRTVTDLVGFVSRYRQPRESKAPKRGLSSERWSLAGCLKATRDEKKKG